MHSLSSFSICCNKGKYICVYAQFSCQCQNLRFFLVCNTVTYKQDLRTNPLFAFLLVRKLYSSCCMFLYSQVVGLCLPAQDGISFEYSTGLLDFVFLLQIVVDRNLMVAKNLCIWMLFIWAIIPFSFWSLFSCLLTILYQKQHDNDLCIICNL